MMIKNESGITVRQLKEFLKDWPEEDPETGEEYEVWLSGDDNASNVCTSVWQLNRGDILLEEGPL